MSEQIVIECTPEQAREWRAFCARFPQLSAGEILGWLMTSQRPISTANTAIISDVVVGVNEFTGVRGQYEREWSPPDPV